MRWAATALLLGGCAAAPIVVRDDAGSDAGPAPSPSAAEFVAAHNAVRARAMPAPMPALPAMAWSDEAAAVAAAWVAQCDYRHNPDVSGHYGENIFAASAVGSRPTDVVEDWAAEVTAYDYATNSCSKVCGHYTQIVWRASIGVGCAHRACTSGSPFGTGAWDFWVCDYVPPGNVVGKKPY